MNVAQIIVSVVTGLLFVGALLLVRSDYAAERELRPLTVFVVWAAYVVDVVLTLWMAWVAPLGRVAVSPVVAQIVGGFLAGVGAWIVFESIATFASFDRMSGMDTSKLVTGGIYRFSRNPQNLGWWLVLLGAAVAGRSVLALALAGFFAVVVHGYIVWMEEPYLEGVYGDAYRDYLDAAPRYLGMPRRERLPGRMPKQVRD